MSLETVAAIEIVLKLQDEHLKSALSRPKGKEAYDYGEAVGINKGFQLVLERLTAEVEKEERSENEQE